jgi:hypothetical protein
MTIRRQRYYLSRELRKSADIQAELCSIKYENYSFHLLSFKFQPSFLKTLLSSQKLMAVSIQGSSIQSFKPIVDRILNTGQLSRQEHLQLVTIFLSDYKVTEEERSQINRLFDEINTGRLKLFN